MSHSNRSVACKSNNGDRVTDRDLDIQLHRQFAIAQYLYNNITDEDKERLLFDPDTGRWSGYKHPYGFKVG